MGVLTGIAAIVIYYIVISKFVDAASVPAFFVAVAYIFIPLIGIPLVVGGASQAIRATPSGTTKPSLRKKTKGQAMILAFGAAVTVASILVTLGANSILKPSATSSVHSRRHSASSAIAGWEVLAQKQMTNTLKDPGSAKYKNVFAYKLVDANGGVSYVFCGEVNAKNGFGGYTGFHSFIATAAGVFVDGQTKDFSKLRGMMCDSQNRAGHVIF